MGSTTMDILVSSRELVQNLPLGKLKQETSSRRYNGIVAEYRSVEMVWLLLKNALWFSWRSREGCSEKCQITILVCGKGRYYNRFSGSVSNNYPR